MELHPLLSQLDKKDRERYMIACKNDLIDFLEDLGLRAYPKSPPALNVIHAHAK